MSALTGRWAERKHLPSRNPLPGSKVTYATTFILPYILRSINLALYARAIHLDNTLKVYSLIICMVGVINTGSHGAYSFSVFLVVFGILNSGQMFLHCKYLSTKK